MIPAVHNNFSARAANWLVSRLLEDADEVPKRLLPVIMDPSHEDFVQIPLMDRPGRRMVHLFKPVTNPKVELKNELQNLVRTRKGYFVFDMFQTPWGNFLVTDGFKLKEI